MVATVSLDPYIFLFWVCPAVQLSDQFISFTVLLPNDVTSRPRPSRPFTTNIPCGDNESITLLSAVGNRLVKRATHRQVPRGRQKKRRQQLLVESTHPR